MRRRLRFATHFLVLIVPVLCLCSPPASAEAVLFSNLGSGSSVYSVSSGWGVYSTTTDINNVAELFTPAGSGSEAVNEIDLAVWFGAGLNFFSASIWTVSGTCSGLTTICPGSQIASWNLHPTTYGSCCALVSVTGISGVDLTGGQEYFMMLTPAPPFPFNQVEWMSNNQGYLGYVIEGPATFWSPLSSTTLGGGFRRSGHEHSRAGFFVTIGSCIDGIRPACLAPQGPAGG